MPYQQIAFDFLKYLPEISGCPLADLVEYLLADGFPENKIDLVIRYIVQSGYRFQSENELLGLRKMLASHPRQNTLAQEFVNCGYLFSFSDVLVMGNPTNPVGQTLAHTMASNGHVFAIQELLRLGNPEDQQKYTVAHDMARSGHCFSLAELFAIGNPKARAGTSVANMMAIGGHKFTVDEKFSLESRGDIIHTYSEIPVGKKYPYQLVYSKGEPLFKTHGVQKKKLNCDFGDFNTMACIFVPDNRFELTINTTKNPWPVGLKVIYQSQPYPFLVQRVAISELIQNFNQAIVHREEFDFSEYPEILNNLCGTSLEMYAWSE